nr:hypothetical protein [Sinomonas atrocyanea]
MGRERQLVLGLARDVPLLRGQRLVLAHGQAGAGLVGARRHRREVLGAQLGDGLELLLEGLGAAELEDDLAQSFADHDRGVRGGVDAAGDRRVEAAELDLVGELEHGLEAGRAGLLHVVGGGLGAEGRPEDGLPGEVEVTAVLEDGARGDLPDLLVLQAEAGHEPVERGGEHVLVRGARVRAVGPGERDAVAADDDGLADARRGRGGHSGPPVGSCDLNYRYLAYLIR